MSFVFHHFSDAAASVSLLLLLWTHRFLAQIKVSRRAVGTDVATRWHHPSSESGRFVLSTVIPHLDQERRVDEKPVPSFNIRSVNNTEITKKRNTERRTDCSITDSSDICHA